MVIGGRDRKFSVHPSPDLQTYSITMADEVTELATTQDETHVVVADVAGNVKLYNLETGAEAGEFPLPTTE